MRLYANGDLETFNTQLTQSGILGNYSFKSDSIVVPQIIEYPSYTNYFIERNSVEGWIEASTGDIAIANEHDRTSDFINVEGWGTATVRMRFINMDGSYQIWHGTYFYTPEKYYYSPDSEGTIAVATGDYVYERKVTIPSDISFIRVSANYYDKEGVTVQISVERGDTQDIGHAIAVEDLASWARNTEHPISIFPEGIVIKGSLINTNI